MADADVSLNSSDDLPFGLSNPGSQDVRNAQTPDYDGDIG